MIRIIVALLVLAVLGAVFAGIYYAPRNFEVREQGKAAFGMGPGEVQLELLPRGPVGSPILVKVQAFGALDLYVVNEEWTRHIAGGGRLSLENPFSYYSHLSQVGLNGSVEFTLISDGATNFVLLFDNSDNYYANDTIPQSTGAVTYQWSARYLEQEARSLVLGYLAAVPSVLLVAVTIGRKLQKRKR